MIVFSKVFPHTHYDFLTNFPKIMSQLTRVTRLTISPPGEPIFSDQTIDVEIEDDAAGEYIKISNPSGQSICINPDEWPFVKDAVENLLHEITLWETPAKTMIS